MKNLFILAISFLSFAKAIAQNDPVIMTIDDKKITKSEFLQIYLKNNDNPKYDKESLDEYMELFKKFKLKVAEAESLGYDTIPKLVKELNGYRKQLALPYLIDSSMNVELITEAYERTVNEIRASHILVKVEPNASPADTLAAFNRILALKKRIENGEDFTVVAKSKGGSEDPSVHDNGGDLGFFTAFQMVYPFENAAYQTKIGRISDPVRTRFGYHIIKVMDKRPARGTIETAHIMIAAGSKDPQESLNAAEAKINEIYELLKEGESFEEMVSMYSDDPTTSSKKGVLPAFGTGTTTRMISEFEDAAFSLAKDGDFCQPIKTNYGFHIIKRLKWHDVPTFDMMKKDLENKVAKDMRSKKTQDSFVSKKKQEYGYKDKSKKGLKWFYTNLDSTYFVGKFEAKRVKTNKPVFVLDNNMFTQQAFAEYLEKNFRIAKKGDIKSMVNEQFKAWEKEAILAYEESQLSKKYPAFKSLLTEYHDGILLYEVMSDLVWNMAMTDTSGLRDFYNQNKDNYRWGKRIDAQIFEFNKKEYADQALILLKNDTMSASEIAKQINLTSELNVKLRQGKYDVNTTNYLAEKNFKVGINDIYVIGDKYYLVYVNQILEPTHKEFNEGKGAITSDYQNYLEQKWIEKLIKKHKVVINYDALYAVGK